MPVSIEEQHRIMELEDWFSSLKTDTLFVDISAAGFKDGALAKRADKSCVFLDKDNLCLIHKKYGLQSKPLACQLFPFVITPFDNEFRIALRFDCSGVCKNSQGKLEDNIKDIKRLAQSIYPPEAMRQKLKFSLPTVYLNEKIEADRFNQINDSILTKISLRELSINKLLVWLVSFAEHISKVKWENVEKTDFSGLLNLLIDGTYKESANVCSEKETVTSKARVLFGQILYILCRGPEIITEEKLSYISKIKKRFSDASALKQFGKNFGPVPKIWDGWDNLDFSYMEESFGEMPEEAKTLLYRYILNRISGMNYCGPNYYNYSMVNGLYSLAFAISAIGWLARANATVSGRKEYEYEDFIRAVMVVDSNNGYGSALNAGGAHLRLKYLKAHCISIINQYVD